MRSIVCLIWFLCLLPLIITDKHTLLFNKFLIIKKKYLQVFSSDILYSTHSHNKTILHQNSRFCGLIFKYLLFKYYKRQKNELSWWMTQTFDTWRIKDLIFSKAINYFQKGLKKAASLFFLQKFCQDNP